MVLPGDRGRNMGENEGQQQEGDGPPPDGSSPNSPDVIWVNTERAMPLWAKVLIGVGILLLIPVLGVLMLFAQCALR